MPGRSLHLIHLVSALTAIGALAAIVAGVPPNLSDGPTQDPGETHHDAQAHDDAQAPHEAQDPTPSPQEIHEPRHEHPFPDRDADADRPSRGEASELEHQFKRFIVHGNEGLKEMSQDGYLQGNGTHEDPYVIQEFRVTDRLEIKDTTKPIVIENSYIEGQLVLNFVGPDIHVHHNHIEDLRVNENVERNQRATSGLIENNTIPYIGQLRHFSGELSRNQIGPRPDDAISEYLSDTGLSTLPEHVTFLLDGYHQAHVHNNTIDGHTEIKLHGHYHGSCQACPPHDHADPDGFPPGNEPHEELEPTSHHSYRYHVLDVENNTFHVEDAHTALRLHDTDHSGDDQTANSEPNAHLEERHDHHQAVRLAGNSMHGAGLILDVVNAQHPRHENMTQHARVQIVGNDATLEKTAGHNGGQVAYEVQQARHAALELRANTFAFTEHDRPLTAPLGSDEEPPDTAGILLDEIHASTIFVNATQGEGGDYGLIEDEIVDTRVDLHENRFDARKEDHHER